MKRERQIHDLPHLKEIRKVLRENLTTAEARLWTMLKGKQLEGRKFRKQHSIENYVVDFYCPEEKLIIKLDGQGHFTPEGKILDAWRDETLTNLGYKVLRFENIELFKNPEGLLETIRSNFLKGE